MAQVVSIQVRIEDGDSSAVLSKIEQGLSSVGIQGATSLKGLGATADGTTASLQRMNTAAAPALRWSNQLEESVKRVSVAAPGIRWPQEFGQHVTTDLDRVRLLSQEFGIRLPRAMESMLSRMPAVTSVIGSFSTGLLAVGGIEVFAHLGKELYDLEQEFLSSTEPINKYYESLKKIADLDFTNVKDIETAQLRLTSARTQVTDHDAMAERYHQEGRHTFNPFTGIADMYLRHQELTEAEQARSQATSLSGSTNDLAHQNRLDQIEAAHASDALLQNDQKRTAELQKQLDINKENQRYTAEHEGRLNPGAKNAGAAEQATADARARAQANVEQVQEQRENSMLRIKALDTQRLAGLEGEAALRQKELNDEREITLELTNQGKADQAGLRVAQMRAQFANEEAARIRELTDQTRKQGYETTAAGLKGIPRVDADLRTQLGGIDEAEDKWRVNGQVSPEVHAQFEQQRINARTASNAKIAEVEATFNDRMKELVDQRTETELGGFARIDAAAQREKDAISKSFHESFGANESGANDQDFANRDAALGAVDQSSNAQKQRLSQKNAADDLQSAREAAQAEARVREQGLLGWVSSYKDSIAEIQLQEAQRMAKLQEDATAEGLTEQEVAQRRVDIEQTANAQIQAQGLNMQHELAGQLQQAFTNPTEFIKQKMEQMFFDIIAAWIMRLDVFKNLFGATMSGLQTGGAAAGGSAGGGILGHVLGLGGAMGGRPSGTAGVISAGTRLPAEYSGTAVGAPGSSTTWDSTASPAAIPASAGGTPTHVGGWESTAPTSTSSVGGDIGAYAGAARNVYGSLRNSGIFGNSSTAAASPIADNGEGGGFAGYMTGDTDADAIIASIGDDSVGAQATQQSTAMQSVGGGVSTTSAFSTAAGDASLAFGAYQGGKGVYDSFFQGGAKGALDGTMSGVEAGAAIGSIVPGIGTLVGGVVGGVVGLATNLVGDLLGESGKMQARQYYRSTLFPALEGIEKSFDQGTGSDWSDAISQANAASASGYTVMRQKFGSDAASWVKANYLDKETAKVVKDITMAAAGGKQYMGRAAAEFHTGGMVTNFHDFATSGTEGFAHLEKGEHITRVQPAAQHAPFLQAINSGANAAQMASMYLQASSGGRSAGGPSVVAGHTLNVSTLDAKSFRKWLDGGPINEVAGSLNQRVGTYSGDSV